MGIPVRACRWGATPKKCLLLLVALVLLLVVPVTAEITYFWDPAFNSQNPMRVGNDFAHYNTSVQLADSILPNSTPWELWIVSGFLGLVLFLYSLRLGATVDELESSILVAAMSCVSIGYCAYSSFAIDRIIGYGVTSQFVNETILPGPSSINNHEYVYMENHLIYSEPTVAVLMMVFFFVVVTYTLYRITKHRALVTGESE